MKRHLAPFAASIASLLACATAQLQIVAPAANNTTDAAGQNRIAGAGGDLRQQILIAESHLTPMIGTNLQALEFRRSASTETFIGGAVHMTVTLSPASSEPIECSETFASNIGTGAQQVYSGPVTLPTSPGATGSTVTWSTNNVIRIQFSTQYIYSGGPLCIDIVGSPIVGQEPGWWMTDCVDEGQVGMLTDLGGGCGMFGSAPLRSHVEQRSLVAGATARMRATGTPYGLGIVAIGPSFIPGTPLGLLGFNNAPAGCALHLSQIDLLSATVFIPDPDPLMSVMGARGDFKLPIPALPAALGFQLTTQWFDWTQSATSNAIEWTIAPSMPSLGMAIVEGHPLDNVGRSSIQRAHVLRFDYQ